MKDYFVGEAVGSNPAEWMEQADSDSEGEDQFGGGAQNPVYGQGQQNPILGGAIGGGIGFPGAHHHQGTCQMKKCKLSKYNFIPTTRSVCRDIDLLSVRVCASVHRQWFPLNNIKNVSFSYHHQIFWDCMSCMVGDPDTKWQLAHFLHQGCSRCYFFVYVCKY